MFIKNCKMFVQVKGGRFKHTITLDEEHEELLAAIMLKDHRSVPNAIERSLEVQFAMYPVVKRDELISQVRQLRKEVEENE